MAPSLVSQRASFSTLKGAVETALSTETFSDWAHLASRAVGFLDDPAHLIGELEKVADQRTTDDAICRAIVQRAYDVLLAIEATDRNNAAALQHAQEQATNAANLIQQGEPREERLALRQEEMTRKEIERANAMLLQRTFKEDADESELIRWVDTVYKQVSPAARAAEVAGDPLADPPVYPHKALEPLKMLSMLCSSTAGRFEAWWRATGERLTWDQLREMAEQANLSYATNDEATAYRHFKEYCVSFKQEDGWVKDFKTPDGLPMTGAAQFAVSAGRLLIKSPANLASTANSWMYQVAIREALPDYLIPHIPADALSGTDARALIRAIANISHEVFDRRKASEKQKQEEKAQFEKEMEARLERKLQDVYMTNKKEYSDAQRSWGRAVSSIADKQSALERAVATSPPPVIAVPKQDRLVIDGPAQPLTHEPSPFKRSALPLLDPKDCKAVTFPATEEGREAYKKALAAFMKLYPGNSIETAPLDAPFPLTPGTFPVPSYSCDACGVTNDHRANACTGTPLPKAERNFRSQWRGITSRRNRAPRHLKPGQGKRILLIEDSGTSIDELFEQSPTVFYVGCGDLARDDDPDCPMNQFIEENQDECRVWLVRAGKADE
ncbi:hypothetical protein JCM10213_003321 [Rhodosporidiobolus nylandii]